jgi:hypothetical protein
MSHDPILTTLYSMVWYTVLSGADRLTFDGGDDGTCFAVFVGGEPRELPAAPNHTFQRIRCSMIELAGLDRNGDDLQTGRIEIPDCSGYDLGTPFGCYANVELDTFVTSNRVELEVVRIDDPSIAGWARKTLQLRYGDDALGTLEYRGIAGMFFDYHFDPTVSFEPLAPIFREEARMRESSSSCDLLAYHEEKIGPLRLYLQPAEGGRSLTGVIHIDGDRACVGLMDGNRACVGM